MTSAGQSFVLYVFYYMYIICSVFCIIPFGFDPTDRCCSNFFEMFFFFNHPFLWLLVANFLEKSSSLYFAQRLSGGTIFISFKSLYMFLYIVCSLFIIINKVDAKCHYDCCPLNYTLSKDTLFLFFF